MTKQEKKNATIFQFIGAVLLVIPNLLEVQNETYQGILAISGFTFLCISGYLFWKAD